MGLERETDISVFSDFGKHCGYDIASDISGTQLERAFVWYDNWCCGALGLIFWQGKYWNGGWHDVNCKWYISWVLGKSGTIYDCAVAFGRDGIIFNCCKEKGAKGQAAIHSIFAGGVSVFTMTKKKIQGSFSIEAAIIVPMLVFLFAITINCGIEMYTECRDMAIGIYEEEELDIVALFYRYQKIGDMVEDGD